MKKIRALAFIFALLMVVSTFCGVLTSCAKKETESEGEEKALEEGGLKGYTLNILSKTPSYSDTPSTLMYTEEANGDTLREAVYARNSKVNAKYGLEVKQTYGEINIVDEVIKFTAAQDDAYQCVTGEAATPLNYLEQNLFYNAATIPYIDMDASYWDSEMMETISVNGFIGGLIGDINFDNYERITLTMYNTPMASDFDIENLYDVTNEGGWTYERMITEMEKVITDLNNDGQYGIDDRIGLLYCSNNLTCYFNAAGIEFVKKDKEGQFYFDDGVNERASLVGEWAAKLIKTKGHSWDWLQMSSANSIATIISMIENKQALFQNMLISQVRRFYREIKTDFGLLPLPKSDESQDKYYSLAGTSAILIPSSNANIEKTGFALEALAQESSDFPNVYFHVALESKFTRDAESIDMIMLCHNNKVRDPLMSFGFGNFVSALDVVVKNGRDYMNVYANLQDAIEEDIEETNSIDIDA